MEHPVLATVSRGYPRAQDRFLTCYSPVRRSPPPEGGFVPRLACVKPAASVRPEPGSNSPLEELHYQFTTENLKALIYQGHHPEEWHRKLRRPSHSQKRAIRSTGYMSPTPRKRAPASLAFGTLCSSQRASRGTVRTHLTTPLRGSLRRRFPAESPHRPAIVPGAGANPSTGAAACRTRRAERRARGGQGTRRRRSVQTAFPAAALP
jgi:hypothetical protein